jgi:hypothetical protein
VPRRPPRQPPSTATTTTHDAGRRPDRGRTTDDGSVRGPRPLATPDLPRTGSGTTLPMAGGAMLAIGNRFVAVRR